VYFSYWNVPKIVSSKDWTKYHKRSRWTKGVTDDGDVGFLERPSIRLRFVLRCCGIEFHAPRSLLGACRWRGSTVCFGLSLITDVPKPICRQYRTDRSCVWQAFASARNDVHVRRSLQKNYSPNGRLCRCCSANRFRYELLAQRDWLVGLCQCRLDFSCLNFILVFVNYLRRWWRRYSFDRRLFVCLSVCLYVSGMTQKVIGGFPWNLGNRWLMKYEFNERNFIVQSLFYYVWFCVLLYYLHFIFYCTHVRMLYVLKPYLLFYLRSRDRLVKFLKVRVRGLTWKGNEVRKAITVQCGSATLTCCICGWRRP